MRDKKDGGERMKCPNCKRETGLVQDLDVTDNGTVFGESVRKPRYCPHCQWELPEEKEEKGP